MRLVVLMYHRVAPGPRVSPEDLTLSPEEFAWQMARLQQDGFTPVGQADVAAWLQGARGLPERPVVVSFDDGYADTMLHAFPLLERLQIPAVSFLVTRRLGGMNEWDTGKLPSWRLMEADDVRIWSKRGIEFGAHGRTHRSLVDVEPTMLAAEIDGSAEDLAALLGAPPLAFAYPYGDVDGAAREHVSRRFALAYGAREGANKPGCDRWELRRTGVSPSHPKLEFWCQLHLGWNPVSKPRNALTRITWPHRVA